MKTSTSRRPNVLWFSFEDTNPLYGCYGDRTARTPNLDRLAADGCRWPNAFSTAGVCAPARSAVITGMYPVSIGTHHMRTSHTNEATPELPTPYSAVPPHYVRCFTEYLRAAGYYCTNNVKTDYQFDPPFTAWDELSSAAHWRNRPDPDQPFFAVFNPTRTHESAMWPEKTPKVTFDPDDIELPPYFPDTPAVREAMARMYTRIEESDRSLGRILDELEEDGLADNTVVVHWSDHGPLPRGKRWPYDSGIHIPMIIRWPGRINPGTVSTRLVSTVDLGPTMLSAAGLPVPAHMQGRAFLGSREAPERQYVYATRDRYDESYDMVRAVRDRRYKYIRHYRPDLPYLLWVPYRNRHPILEEMWRLHLGDELTGPQRLMFDHPRPVEELYDTAVDPWEINNLADDPAHRGELTRLRKALDDWRADIGDMGEISESEMVRTWYPGGRQPVTAAPVFVPISAASYGTRALNTAGTMVGGAQAASGPATGGANEPADDPARAEIDVPAPAALQLHCATQGASIGYRYDSEREGAWRLYTTPLRLAPGRHTITAKAIRIGYAESEEARLTVNVQS